MKLQHFDTHFDAKGDTLKATIIYSGRQHANEVSSTSPF